MALVATIFVALFSGGAAPKEATRASAATHPRPGAGDRVVGAAAAKRRRAAGPEPPDKAPPPAAEAGVLAWQLQAPISREAVFPGSGHGQLLIAGGLSADGSSDMGIYRLSTADGALSLVGNLPAATHDAAFAEVGQRGLVIGGGSATPAATSFSVPLQGRARSVGSLPQVRADAAAVTVGPAVYVVGGYDGPRLDPEVLSTVDGSHYRAVAKLPEPVRYPAVASLRGLIYVFGGQSATGSPVSTIQVVDPHTGTARVEGQMPLALSGPVAADLGGVVYVAGGVSRGATGVLSPVKDVFALDVGTGKLLRAGTLPVAVANAGAAVSGGRLYVVGGETAGATPTAAVQVINPARAFGTAGRPGAGSPYFGDRLLVADRGNDRLVLLDDTGRIVWSYPSKVMPPPPGGFYFPDDAFFIHRGTAIISNQEENDTVVELSFPHGRLLWSYGHPRRPGAGPGYLDNPDDAYLLKNGEISVADPMNCRVVVIDPKSKRVLHQIGTPGVCTHKPPTYLGSPNGDTPLSDGNLLVSEINGSWVDEYTLTGHLVWAAHLPIGYPSDPQPLGPGRYLVADYERPGAVLEFDRAGRVLYRYQPPAGPGELEHPSLAEMLPSGVFMINDDYNDRMVAIDPATGALVWQYGRTGVAGTSPGLLNTPDGFDLLAPGGRTPTHPGTG